MTLEDCHPYCKGIHEDETVKQWEERTGYGSDVYYRDKKRVSYNAIGQSGVLDIK